MDCIRDDISKMSPVARESSQGGYSSIQRQSHSIHGRLACKSLSESLFSPSRCPFQSSMDHSMIHHFVSTKLQSRPLVAEICFPQFRLQFHAPIFLHLTLYSIAVRVRNSFAIKNAIFEVKFSILFATNLTFIL